MLKNNITKNVFSEEEIQQIKSCIDNELKTREHINHEDLYEGMVLENDKVFIKKNLGRLDIPNLFLPESILLKMFDFATKNNLLDKSYINEISDIRYCRYSGKYGNPKLEPHLDYGESGLILDYQLESNTSWPITIESVDYILEDNDLIILYPLNQYHWRPNKSWSNDEFLDVIFFDFHTPGLTRNPNHEKEKELRGMVYNKDGGFNK